MGGKEKEGGGGGGEECDEVEENGSGSDWKSKSRRVCGVTRRHLALRGSVVTLN